jgi:hypothetical protein
LSRTISGTVTVIPLFAGAGGASDGVLAARGTGKMQQSRAVRSMVMDRRMEDADGCTEERLLRSSDPRKSFWFAIALLQQE